MCLSAHEMTRSETSPHLWLWVWHTVSAKRMFVQWRMESWMCNNMDGWTDGQMDEWVDGQRGRQMENQ